MNPLRKLNDKRRLLESLTSEHGDEVKRATGKSRIRQAMEIIYFRLRGFKEQQYYILRLYARDRPDFMSNRAFRQHMARINPQISGMVEFNKWVFFHYMKSHGLPVPECHGVFHTEFGYQRSGDLRTFEQLTSLIKAKAPVVLKPIAGGRGESVTVIDRVESGNLFVRPSGATLDADELFSRLSMERHAWLVQAKVNQHPAISELYPGAINTCRLITLRDTRGHISLLAAVFRIGVGGGEIDNTSGGGLAAWIDNGQLGKLYAESSHEGLSRHPDTRAQIEGFRLPYWEEIVELAHRAHRCLPFARTFGWDIALAEVGPTILETNGYWYQDHVQKLGGISLYDTAFAKHWDL